MSKHWIHGNYEYRGIVVECQRMIRGWVARLRIAGDVTIQTSEKPTQDEAELALIDGTEGWIVRSQNKR